MKRIFLLRHAKSDWSDPEAGDHQRPLNRRGRRAAAALAEYIRQQRIRPDIILCSTATRARETLERLGDAAGDATVRHEKALYLAGPEKLLARLARLPAETRSAMLVGHNPGMQILAMLLAGPGSDRAAAADLGRGFATGALACFEADSEDWRGLVPGDARLVSFVRPRNLDADGRLTG